MITRASSLIDVAFEVCTALDAAGFTAVLTGGSAATFYAPEAYQSLDIDFVITMAGKHGAEVLAAHGFKARDGQYVHADSPFPVEFPKGPLMVGDDRIESWSTERRGARLLHVLSPTDSCRDRLAGFLFWNDFSALDQALAVANAQGERVDTETIAAWCLRERQPEKYHLFQKRLGRG